MSIVSPEFILHLTVGIAAVILVLIAIILFLTIQKEQRQLRRKNISAQLEDWLAGVVLDDESTLTYNLPGEIQAILRLKTNRLLLLEELIVLKRNLDGAASANIERLYQQLKLDRLSLKKIKSRHWHIKAKGVQELAIMRQKQHLRKIYSYINHPNIFVRMEVQAGLVQYWGAKGLRFLTHLTYPLTEWQQQKLLHFLLQQTSLQDLPVKKWIESSNASVVQFALKFIGEQHDLRYYSEVVNCLSHANEAVRLQAITCLERIATEDTTEMLALHFTNSSKDCQVAILNVLQNIGTAGDLYFLRDCAVINDAAIKLAAVKAIAEIGKREIDNTQTLQFAKAS